MPSDRKGYSHAKIASSYLFVCAALEEGAMNHTDGEISAIKILSSAFAVICLILLNRLASPGIRVVCRQQYHPPFPLNLHATGHSTRINEIKTGLYRK